MAPHGGSTDPVARDDGELIEGSAPAQQGPQPKKRKEYTRIEPTTPEQLIQEDLINNCAVKTVISGVMGSALGVAFGIFMGAMDSAVSIPPERSPVATGQMALCNHPLFVRAKDEG